MSVRGVVCKPHPFYTGFRVRLYRRDKATGEGGADSFEMSPIKNRRVALQQAREALKTEQGQELFWAAVVEARSMVNCRRA